MGFFDQPPFGTVFALDNVPKSTVKGGELAIVWRPVDGLNLSGAVTYVDAKIKKYSGLNSDSVFTDFAGDRVPFAPKWNASENADYTVPLGASLAVHLGDSLTYNSSTRSEEHTSELQSLMRTSYAVFCLKKTKHNEH